MFIYLKPFNKVLLVYTYRIVISAEGEAVIQLRHVVFGVFCPLLLLNTLMLLRSSLVSVAVDIQTNKYI